MSFQNRPFKFRQLTCGFLKLVNNWGSGGNICQNALTLVTFPIILLKVLGLRSSCWTLSKAKQPFFGNLLNGFFKKSPVVAST